MFDVPPPLLARGLDAYMATWKTFFGWSARPVAFDFHDLEIAAGPDVPFATAIEALLQHGAQWQDNSA